MLRDNFGDKEIRKEIDEKGTTRYYDAAGRLHRDGGPAFVKKDLAGWYQHGVVHRDDGPAVEADDGFAWYRNGKLHRDDGPAIEIPGIRDGSGDQWWIDGKRLTKEEFVSVTQGKLRKDISPRP